MLRPVRFRSALVLGALAGWVLCPGSACQFSTEPPPLPGAPASCGDGHCDPLRESCGNCPTDCPCCAAASCEGSVPGVEACVGKPDGKAVQLAEYSSVEVALGSEVTDLPGDDLRFEGAVASASNVEVVGCPLGSGGTGSFEVWVSADGRDFKLAGFWSQKDRAVDLSCVQLKTARWVRLVGQPGARGQLDAVIAVSCSQ